MRSLGILISLIIIASCSNAPPVPTDKFYRLGTPQNVGQLPATEHIIYVGPILTEGLYNERALLHTGESGNTELQQYHYHFWITSPPRLMQDYLVSYLRAASSSTMINTEPGAGEKISIFGRLKAFEKIDSEEQSAVNVRLELRVQDTDKAAPILLKEYSAIEKIGGNEVPDAVAGFDRAAAKIYSDFVTDLQAILN